jgi:hypothetical protein
MSWEDEEEDVSSYQLTFGETREYWQFKEEAPDRTLWRTGFGEGYGLVVRQTTK